LEFFKPPDVRRVPDIPVEDADILLKETLEKIRVKRKRAGISLREILKNVLDDREEKHRIDRNRPSSSNSDYIVVASQLESSNGCREKLLKIKFGSDVFKDLRKGINGFRGWRGFFSLKSLKAFGIFKVSKQALGSRQNRKLTSSSVTRYRAAIIAFCYRLLRNSRSLSFLSLIQLADLTNM